MALAPEPFATIQLVLGSSASIRWCIRPYGVRPPDRCGAFTVARSFFRLYHQVPNNALQRTEAGGGPFLAIHVFLRQPASLSLEAVRPLRSSRVGFSDGEPRFPFSSQPARVLVRFRSHGFCLSGSSSASVSAFPAAATQPAWCIPPPESTFVASIVQRSEVSGRLDHQRAPVNGHMAVLPFTAHPRLGWRSPMFRRR